MGQQPESVVLERRHIQAEYLVFDFMIETTYLYDFALILPNIGLLPSQAKYSHADIL